MKNKNKNDWSQSTIEVYCHHAQPPQKILWIVIFLTPYLRNEYDLPQYKIFCLTIWKTTNRIRGFIGLEFFFCCQPWGEYFFPSLFKNKNDWSQSTIEVYCHHAQPQKILWIVIFLTPYLRNEYDLPQYKIFCLTIWKTTNRIRGFIGLEFFFFAVSHGANTSFHRSLPWVVNFFCDNFHLHRPHAPSTYC